MSQTTQWRRLVMWPMNRFTMNCRHNKIVRFARQLLVVLHKSRIKSSTSSCLDAVLLFAFGPALKKVPSHKVSWSWKSESQVIINSLNKCHLFIRGRQCEYGLPFLAHIKWTLDDLLEKFSLEFWDVSKSTMRHGRALFFSLHSSTLLEIGVYIIGLHFHILNRFCWTKNLLTAGTLLDCHLLCRCHSYFMNIN